MFQLTGYKTFHNFKLKTDDLSVKLDEKIDLKNFLKPQVYTQIIKSNHKSQLMNFNDQTKNYKLNHLKQVQQQSQIKKPKKLIRLATSSNYDPDTYFQNYEINQQNKVQTLESLDHQNQNKCKSGNTMSQADFHKSHSQANLQRITSQHIVQENQQKFMKYQSDNIFKQKNDLSNLQFNMNFLQKKTNSITNDLVSLMYKNKPNPHNIIENIPNFDHLANNTRKDSQYNMYLKSKIKKLSKMQLFQEPPVKNHGPTIQQLQNQTSEKFQQHSKSTFYKKNDSIQKNNYDQFASHNPSPKNALTKNKSQHKILLNSTSQNPSPKNANSVIKFNKIQSVYEFNNEKNELRQSELNPFGIEDSNRYSDDESSFIGYVAKQQKLKKF